MVIGEGMAPTKVAEVHSDIGAVVANTTRAMTLDDFSDKPKSFYPVSGIRYPVSGIR